MCTSTASMSRRRNAPSAQPRSRIRVISSIAGELTTAKLENFAMCSARWMFSMLTSRMKSGCDSW
jgi:hypothetical protein